MIEDPIVNEVRSFRSEHAAKYGNDLKLIVEVLKKLERDSKRIVLNPEPKLIFNLGDISYGYKRSSKQYYLE